MTHLVAEASLEARVRVDSAGTSAYHVGEPADARSRSTALSRGIDLTSISRRFVREDFGRFDYVVAMDRNNLSALRQLGRAEEGRAKLHLLRSFDRASGRDLDVPDPYYGGPHGFDRVFDICFAGCQGLLDHMRRQDL